MLIALQPNPNPTSPALLAFGEQNFVVYLIESFMLGYANVKFNKQTVSCPFFLLSYSTSFFFITAGCMLS
jgi:hypothetical protein